MRREVESSKAEEGGGGKLHLGCEESWTKKKNMSDNGIPMMLTWKINK